MSTDGQRNPRIDAETLAERMRKHATFLEWDREINGKLYYALWILFMGGFALSITPRVSGLTGSLCTLWLLRAFRILAVVGSALNFELQNRAINQVRYSREQIREYEQHIAHAETAPQKALAAYHRANDLETTLKSIDAQIPKIELGLKLCAVGFLIVAICLTWRSVPNLQ